jgi:hypothetical protein
VETKETLPGLLVVNSVPYLSHVPNTMFYYLTVEGTLCLPDSINWLIN